MRQCILFFQLINICLSTITNADMDLPFEEKKTLLQRSLIGSILKATGKCKFELRINDPAAKLSKPYFNVDEFDSLVEPNTAIDTIYLPHQLKYFHHIGVLECPTKIIIDENASYKLETLILSNLHQLPDNIDRLKSLKELVFARIHGAIVDSTKLASMIQLEDIQITALPGVIITNSWNLPHLQKLMIYHTPMMFFNNVLCSFPKLATLVLHSNNLEVVPGFFSTFTMLKVLQITQNELRHINPDLFVRMNQLEFLELNNNRLSAIIAQTPVKLPRLTTLQLDNNNLAKLNITLWSIPSLQHLTLSGNQLKRVPGLLTLIGKKLNTLKMEDNPWNCEWLEQTVRKIPGMQLVTSNSGCFAAGQNLNQGG